MLFQHVLCKADKSFPFNNARFLSQVLDQYRYRWGIQICLQQTHLQRVGKLAGTTGLEPATSCVTDSLFKGISLILRHGWQR